MFLVAIFPSFIHVGLNRHEPKVVRPLNDNNICRIRLRALRSVDQTNVVIDIVDVRVAGIGIQNKQINCCTSVGVGRFDD